MPVAQLEYGMPYAERTAEGAGRSSRKLNHTRQKPVLQPARNSSTARQKACGLFSNIQWRPLGMTAVRAPAICSAITRQLVDSAPVVSAPPIKSAGVLIKGMSSRLYG